MKLWIVALGALLLSFLSGCGGAEPTAPHQNSEFVKVADAHALLKYLHPALYPTGESYAAKFYLWKPARLSYSGTCEEGGFAPIKLQLSNGQMGLSAVREMLQNEKQVSVTEDVSGVIRIRIGKVPDAILQTKISRLTLKPDERYSAILAIRAIENTQDMQSEMRRRRLRPFPTLVTLVRVPPVAGMPRLPSMLKNVTVDQILDSIAQTFHGIIIYVACTDDANLFKIEFD